MQVSKLRINFEDFLHNILRNLQLRDVATENFALLQVGRDIVHKPLIAAAARTAHIINEEAAHAVRNLHFAELSPWLAYGGPVACSLLRNQ